MLEQNYDTSPQKYEYLRKTTFIYLTVFKLYSL